jgi:hypothetical protein
MTNINMGELKTIIVGIIYDLEEIYVVKFKLTDDFKCYYSEIPKKTLHLNTKNGKTKTRIWFKMQPILVEKNE